MSNSEDTIFARALMEYSDQSNVSDDGEVDLDELGLGLLPDLVADAASVVLAGFPVIAIWYGTKSPLHPAGSELPNHQEFWLRSVAAVEAAYLDEDMGCQFAVITGVPNAEGDCMVVLDNDEGDLDALLAEAGEQAQHWAEQTLKVQRIPERSHLYGLVAVEDCPPSMTLGEGLEWRGTGGYVLLPGSKHPSGDWYQITRSAPPLRVPRELIKLVRSKAQPKPATPTVEATSAQPLGEISYEDLDGPAKARMDAYLAAALDGIATTLAASRTWPEGRRDDRGRGWEKLQADAAYRLARLVLAAWNQLDEDEAHDLFIGAAPIDAGWTAAKRETKWRSQWVRAVHKGPAPYPDDDTELPLSFKFIDDHEEEQDHRRAGDGAQVRPGPLTGSDLVLVGLNPDVWAPGEVETIWGTRPIFETTREWARFYEANPWGTLGAVIPHTICAVPPNVVTGTRDGALNLICAEVGEVGAGKGEASNAAKRAVVVINGMPFKNQNPGTGEGLLAGYGYWGSDPPGTRNRSIRLYDSVLIDAREVTMLTKLANRQGATLEGILLRQLVCIDGWPDRCAGRG